jgi:hypothetical protein
MKYLNGSRLAALALVPLLALGACDRSPVSSNDHEQLGTVVILDRSTTPHTPLATWTHAGGWDSAELMQVSHGREANRTRVSLGVQMMNRGGETIALSRDGEYSVRYGVASDPGNVVDMSHDNIFHGDHIHLYGFHETGRTGTAQIVFALWHGDHSDAETAPIGITFVP